MSTTNPTGTAKTSFFSGRKMWLWIATALGIISTTLLVLLLQGLTSTTTYYVINQSVPARTLVTESMLTGVITSNGGQPPTAIDLSTVNAGETYTSIELNPGDVLTASNTGDLIPLAQGIPDDYVIASFAADPNLSAGGNIQRGDYVDVTALLEGDDGISARLILQRVLVLDATVDLGSAPAESEETSTEGTGDATDLNNVTAQYRNGVPSLYTVGVTQADAAKLAFASQTTIYLTLSSVNSVEDGVEATPADLTVGLADLFSQPANDAGVGTDNTFGKAPEESTGSEESTDSSSEAPETETSETPTE